MDVLTLFFLLLIGHAVGDYVLQPGPMSTGKNRHKNLVAMYGVDFPPWYYWLSAHALVHAAIVYAITTSPLFALIEAGSHWATDYLKCGRRINLHVDQGLHIAVKLLFCVIIALT